MKAHNEEGSTGACAWLRVCVYARTCVRHDGCMCVRACVCACACARAQVLCVCIVRVLCASCSCMRVRVVRALCVSACARVRADGGACHRLLAPKGVPLLACSALTCRVERGRSAGAAVGGGVACCWVSAGSAGCGSGAKGLLPGGATPRPSQVGDGMPLTKAAASSVTSHSQEDHRVKADVGRVHRVCHRPVRRADRGSPRACIDDQSSDREGGRAPGNQRVRGSGPRRTVG